MLMDLHRVNVNAADVLSIKGGRKAIQFSRMLTPKAGGGLVNTIIDKLPVELHLPGYNYCGPGTKLSKRLARNDPGINELDEACKEHDIAYSESSEFSKRHKADKILEKKAWKRFKSKDASFGEKGHSLLVAGAMKIKRKLGSGAKTFRSAILGPIRKCLKAKGDIRKDSIAALKAARLAVKKAGGRKKIRVPRIIPFESKSGGVLPLIPILAGLSALGSLLGGAGAVAKTVIDAKNATKKLDEEKRHNSAMESIGHGLFVRKSKRGYGLYLQHQQKSSKNR